MISWTCLALLAVASAAPQQLQQQPLRSQIISASQLPLSSQLQSLPINYQTIQPQLQSLPINYQTIQPQLTSQIQTLPINYQSVQPQLTSQIQTLPINYQTVQPQISYQSVPLNSLNYQLPVQQLRVSQIKPATQLRTQTYKSTLVQPAVTVQRRVIPQVQNVAIQQRVIPQVQNVAVQRVIPQVQNVAIQQRVVPQLTIQQGVAPTGTSILRQVQESQADGSYVYAYETENGIKAQEEGRTVNQGTDAESSVVQGSYSYVAPDGTPITVNYIADENGFRAEGEHIPKPSEEIQRSVDYLRSLPPRPEDEEGKYVPEKY